MSEADTTIASPKRERIKEAPKSKNVRLRELRAEDSNLVSNWFRQPGSTVSITDFADFPSDFEEYEQLQNDYCLVGELRKLSVPAGSVSLIHEHDAAEFCRFVVPEEYRIFRLEIALLVLMFAFENLKVSRVHAFVLPENSASLQFHTSLGFRMIQQGDVEWRGRKINNIHWLQMDAAEFARIKEKYAKTIRG